MNDAEGWVTVTTSDTIAEGTGREFLVERQIIAIFRFEGQLFAMDGICPHQGGPLADGQLQGGCVTCPWHGWQYELKSGRHTISGRQLVPTFVIRERDGAVEVRFGEEPH